MVYPVIDGCGAIQLKMRRYEIPASQFNALSAIMIGIFVRATAYAGLIARKQGCYPADNDTAIAPLWAVAGDQQELLAIASRDKIFGRHAEALGEEIGDSLRPPVRQAEIVHGRADGVCVAFDQEHLTRVLPYNVRHNGGYTLEPVLLIGADLPRSEFKMDGVDVHAAHAFAQVDAGDNLVQGVGPLQRFEGRGLQTVVNVVFGGLLRV